MVLATLPILASHVDLSFGENVKKIKPTAPTREVGYWDFLDERIYVYPLTEDEQAYAMLARNALAGKGFSVDNGWFIVPREKPTSYWNCCYPLFVTACFGLLGEHLLAIWLIQILMSAASCFLIWRLAGMLFSEKAAWLGYGAAVIYPPYVLNSIWMMTEALAVPLVITCLYFVYRGLVSAKARDFVFAGLALGAAALTRSTAFYYLIFLAVGIWVAGASVRRRLRVKYVATLAAATFAVILPWTFRNWRVHHAFMLIDTKVGVNLWMFNNPNQVLGYKVQNSDMPLLEFRPDATEVEMDRAYFKLGKDYVRSHKAQFLKTFGIKALLALNPIPKQAHSGKMKLVALLTAGWLLILAPVGIFASRKRWRELMPLYLLIGYWILIQAGSAAGMRYRMPAEVAWILLAAAGAVAILAVTRRVLVKKMKLRSSAGAVRVT